jgi:CDP-diacylglycerol--glycerol-3-phosphate 3-phosphatidyltransferase
MRLVTSFRASHYAPLVLVSPFTRRGGALVNARAAGSAFIGLAGSWLGVSRRSEGPLGKSDRLVAIGAIGAWLAIAGSLPVAAALLMPVFAVLLLATIANRLRFAAAENRSERP